MAVFLVLLAAMLLLYGMGLRTDKQITTLLAVDASTLDPKFDSRLDGPAAHRPRPRRPFAPIVPRHVMTNPKRNVAEISFTFVRNYVGDDERGAPLEPSPRRLYTVSNKGTLCHSLSLTPPSSASAATACPSRAPTRASARRLRCGARRPRSISSG